MSEGKVCKIFLTLATPMAYWEKVVSENDIICSYYTCKMVMVDPN